MTRKLSQVCKWTILVWFGCFSFFFNIFFLARPALFPSESRRFANFFGVLVFAVCGLLDGVEDRDLDWTRARLFLNVTRARSSCVFNWNFVFLRLGRWLSRCCRLQFEFKRAIHMQIVDRDTTLPTIYGDPDSRRVLRTLASSLPPRLQHLLLLLLILLLRPYLLSGNRPNRLTLVSSSFLFIEGTCISFWLYQKKLIRKADLNMRSTRISRENFPP